MRRTWKEESYILGVLHNYLYVADTTANFRNLFSETCRIRVLRSGPIGDELPVNATNGRTLSAAVYSAVEDFVSIASCDCVCRSISRFKGTIRSIAPARSETYWLYSES